MTATTQALMGGMLKILILSQILPVNLVDKLQYLSVVVTGDKYCTLGRVYAGLEN